MPLTASQPLLGPLVALNLWTFGMEAWMYALRLPAMSKYGVTPHPGLTKAEINSKIPRHLQFPADNYDHLLGQPTQFYAVTVALALLSDDSPLSVRLAWGYVGLRVLHSLVQATRNPIMIRFQIFAASSVVLLAMTVRAAMVVF